MRNRLLIFLATFLLQNTWAQEQGSIVVERYIHGDLSSSIRYAWRLDDEGKIAGFRLDAEMTGGESWSKSYALKTRPDGTLYARGSVREEAIEAISESLYEYRWKPGLGLPPTLWRYRFEEGGFSLMKPEADRPPSTGLSCLARFAEAPGGGVTWEENGERAPIARASILETGKGRYAYSYEVFHYPRYAREWSGELVFAEGGFTFAIDSIGEEQYRILCSDAMAMGRALSTKEGFVIVCSLGAVNEAAPGLYFLLACLLEGGLW